MTNRALIVGVAVVGAVLLSALPAAAQTNAEVNAGIQINFSTPGARSLGLGGAFFGLADDATAAFTNPAGLTTLSKMEVSIEGRQWDFTSTFTDAGHAYGEPSGEGVDNIAGLQMGEVDTDTTGLSFLSLVYPGEGWALAFYRHELANFETSYATQGAFTGSDPVYRFYPIQASMDLQIENLGASLAVRLTDNFTVGLGASRYNFEMDSVTSRYDFDFTVADPTDPGGFYGVPNYADDNVVNFQSQIGDDSDTTFNIGLLWNLGSKVSMGVVYRQGPEFDVVARNCPGAGSAVSCTDDGSFRWVDTSFKVPDVYGIGFAFRVTDAFTIAFDWAHVQYSDMINWTTRTCTEELCGPNAEDVIDPETGNDRIVGNLFPASLDDATGLLDVDDADEFHLGLEYVFVNASVPVALRVGGWFDPDHKVAFRGDPGDDPNLQTLAALFQEGDDQIHYSAGLGLIFGERFQLDAAVDFADTITTIALSGVFRF